LPSLIPHDHPPQQVIEGPLRAGMDSGAVEKPATYSILTLQSPSRSSFEERGNFGEILGSSAELARSVHRILPARALLERMVAR